MATKTKKTVSKPTTKNTRNTKSAVALTPAQRDGMLAAYQKNATDISTRVWGSLVRKNFAKKAKTGFALNATGVAYAKNLMKKTTSARA